MPYDEYTPKISENPRYPLPAEEYRKFGETGTAFDHIPTNRELKLYRDKMLNDPDPELHKYADGWPGLGMHTQLTDPEVYVPVVSRAEWGAHPTREGALPLDIPVMYIRYTWVGQSDDCRTVDACSRFLRNLQQSSMAEGLVDIPFNFLVGHNGIVYEGRGWDWEADREQKYNDFEGLHGKLKGKTVDIAYVGDLTMYQPSNEQASAAFDFAKYSWLNNKIHDMFEPIPFKENPTNLLTQEAYYDPMMAISTDVGPDCPGQPYPQPTVGSPSQGMKSSTATGHHKKHHLKK